MPLRRICLGSSSGKCRRFSICAYTTVSISVTWGKIGACNLGLCYSWAFTIMPSENWWCWVGAGGRSPGLKWDGAPLNACLTLVRFPSKPGSGIKSLHYLAINEVIFLSQNCLAHATLIPGKHCNTTITWAKKSWWKIKQKCVTW